MCAECICLCNATLRLIGNGFCNDETNSLECNFDGGDCCGACVNTNLCTECVCHKPLAIDLSCKYLLIVKSSFKNKKFKLKN